MFDTLSDRLESVFKSLRSKGRLTDADIDATLREIRIALLEADVALPVVREFVAGIRERARGAEVSQALNPAQQVISIVNDELIRILGGETRRLRFAKNPPSVIMLAGLQGSGKTTLAGKLAKWLVAQGHAPVLVACDLQRPNAVQQLQVLGERAGVPVFAPEPGNGVGDPVAVARSAVEHARRMQHDVMVVDTAGRLGVDAELMQQAADIRDAIEPDEILFVVDAMIGQDAVTTAQAFLDGVGFDGVVLTKLDGDARGGAALSVASITGRQVMFASTGEKLEDFDVFHPDRMASRILGMGDLLTLIEQTQAAFDEDEAEATARKLTEGDLTLEDFLDQMMAVRKMGPDRQPARHVAGHGADERRHLPDRRPRHRPHRGHHPFDDARRTRQPENHQRFAPGAHREGLWCHGHRGEQPRRPVLRGAQDDEADGRWHGHARHAPRGQGQVGQGEEEGWPPRWPAGRRCAHRAAAGPRPWCGRAARRVGCTGSASSGHVRPRPHEAEVPTAGWFRQDWPAAALSALHVRAVVLPDAEVQDLYAVDGRLTFDRPASLDIDTIGSAGFVLPGLVDAHCHVGLAPEGGVPIEVAREQAVTDRDTGALLLRDAGVPEAYYELDDDPRLPRIVHAGRHLARTRRYLRNYGIEMEPAELPAAAEAQARRPGGHGAPWVKLVGDWIDRAIGDLAPCWPRDALVEAVSRAHAAGARVAVHVFGEEALPDLIAAGVDSIEHGTGLTADLIDDVARRGIAVVPTLVNIANFDKFADQATKYPVYADRMRRLRAGSAQRLHAAYDAGIPLYVGTDAGGQLPHGLVVDEMIAMRDIGIPDADVLAAGSWRAREWLGLPGLVEGAPADFVVYDDDPRKDVSVLRNPRRIVVRGNVVR